MKWLNPEYISDLFIHNSNSIQTRQHSNLDIIVPHVKTTSYSPGARRVLFMFCLPKGC